MALTFMKRSAIPVATRGKVSTSPSVTISDKGQIMFNKLASEFLADKKVAFAFDGNKMYVFRGDAKSVAKVAAEEFFQLGKSEKNGTMYISAGALLKTCPVPYDYAKSGNQGFIPTVDKDKGFLMVELPASGSLTAKPKVARVKKPKTGGTQAAANSTNSSAVDKAIADATDEIELDAA